MYRAAKVWREKTRGLLKPLLVLDRLWSEIFIDFMTYLPAKNKGDPYNIMVIVNRLLKTVILEAIASIKAESVVNRFKECF